MPIRKYLIVDKHKDDMLAVASTRDFMLREDGTLTLDAFARLNGHMPYCIDLENGTVWLVDRGADDHHLSDPFFYEGQYRKATSVVEVDIGDFANIALAFPPPRDATFIHSTGRCGSTLLSRTLAAGLGLPVISEPDAFTGVALVGALRDPGMAAAFGGVYEALIRYFARDRRHVVFKFRTLVCQHAEYIGDAGEARRSVFLFRNAVDVAKSYARITGRPLAGWQLSDRERRVWQRYAPALERLEGTIDGYDLVCALWASPVVKFLDTRESGIWHKAIDYETIVNDPEKATRDVYPGGGQPDAAAIRLAIADHAQAGSHLNPANRRHVAELEEQLGAAKFCSKIDDRLQRIDPRLCADMVLE